MTIEEIRKFRNAEPFQPFRLRLSDGRKLLVRQPENIGWGGTGRKVVVYEREAADVIDRESIVKVEIAKLNSTRSSNPKRR